MKRSLVAIAVSGAALASFSASAADEAKADIYGSLNLAYSNTNPDVGSSTSQLEDNGSAIGFKGESAEANGLTAFFDIKLKTDMDEKESDATVELDQAFLGVKGDFGTVKAGTFDSIYGDAIQDGIDQFEFVGVGGSATTEEGDTIAYFSPEMNGLQLQLAAQVKGDGDDEVVNNTAKDGQALTAVLSYKVSSLTVAAGYDSKATSLDDDATFGLSANYLVNPALSVMVKLEQDEDTDTRTGVGASYQVGTSRVYASAQQVDPDGGSNYTEYGVGISYGLNDNLLVFAEASQQDAAEDQYTALGATYSF